MQEKMDFSDLINTPCDQIKKLMDEQAMTIEALADTIGLEPEVLENILRYSRGRVTGEMLNQIAAALGVTREWLLEGAIR